jgi:hypothetical protein
VLTVAGEDWKPTATAGEDSFFSFPTGDQNLSIEASEFFELDKVITSTHTTQSSDAH